MIDRLALGTVQFGLDYGIRNKRGIIPPEEIRSILLKAGEAGIDTLDTAAAYGRSEEVLGSILPMLGTSFNIISKARKDSDPVVSMESSMATLKTLQLYGFLFHDFEHFKNDLDSFHALEILKNKGLVRKIGFSLYHTEELDYLFEKQISFDLIQVPYNIFDRRFEKYFPVLKERNVEIHTRSAFLQGLFFIRPDQLHEQFNAVRNKLSKMNSFSSDLGYSIGMLALGFCLFNQYVDKVVIGIDSLDDLNENIDTVNRLNNTDDFRSWLGDLRVDDLNIILPYKWQAKK